MAETCECHRHGEKPTEPWMHSVVCEHYRPFEGRRVPNCFNCDHGTDPKTLTTCNECAGTGFTENGVRVCKHGKTTAHTVFLDTHPHGRFERCPGPALVAVRCTCVGKHERDCPFAESAVPATPPQHDAPDSEAEKIAEILERADQPSNYDGDEDEGWIVTERILPDLKHLADAYRALRASQPVSDAERADEWKRRCRAAEDAYTELLASQPVQYDALTDEMIENEAVRREDAYDLSDPEQSTQPDFVDGAKWARAALRSKADRIVNCTNCNHGTDPKTLTTCDVCAGTGDTANGVPPPRSKADSSDALAAWKAFCIQRYHPNQIPTEESHDYVAFMAGAALRSLGAKERELVAKWRDKAPGLDPLHRNGMRGLVEDMANELAILIGDTCEPRT